MPFSPYAAFCQVSKDNSRREPQLNPAAEMRAAPNRRLQVCFRHSISGCGAARSARARTIGNLCNHALSQIKSRHLPPQVVGFRRGSVSRTHKTSSLPVACSRLSSGILLSSSGRRIQISLCRRIKPQPVGLDLVPRCCGRRAGWQTETMQPELGQSYPRPSFLRPAKVADPTYWSAHGLHSTGS